MDYRELLKAYMTNVSKVSGIMTEELVGYDCGGDFLGTHSLDNLDEQQHTELVRISDELVAEGKIDA